VSVLTDIKLAYYKPRNVMKRQISSGIKEEQTLFFAILFGLLSFLSLLPAIAKHAYLTNESLSALAAAQFISSVFMMPLLMYGIAAISHLILKYFWWARELHWSKKSIILGSFSNNTSYIDFINY
jgi:hypothetical protein